MSLRCGPIDYYAARPINIYVFISIIYIPSINEGIISDHMLDVPFPIIITPRTQLN